MAELRNKPTKQEKVAEFDPTKNYKWEPDAEFVLSGAEFDLLYKALRGNLQTPEFVAHVNQYEALKLVEKTFISGVEAGVITEMEIEEAQEEIISVEAEEVK